MDTAALKKNYLVESLLHKGPLSCDISRMWHVRERISNKRHFTGNLAENYDIPPPPP